MPKDPKSLVIQDRDTLERIKHVARYRGDGTATKTLRDLARERLTQLEERGEIPRFIPENSPSVESNRANGNATAE
jgi:hypothetical protein